MVNLTQNLLLKARDLRGGARNRRVAVQEKHVGFIERAPLALKNRVHPRSEKNAEKACMKPMMEMINCLEKYDQNQNMCEKEILSFQDCYENFKLKDRLKTEEKAAMGKNAIPHGNKLNGNQLNMYIKKFPFSQRTKQWYIDPSMK